MAKQPIALVECEGGGVRVAECKGRIGVIVAQHQGVLMQPHEARALATYLVAVADGIEGKQQTDPHAG